MAKKLYHLKPKTHYDYYYFQYLNMCIESYLHIKSGNCKFGLSILIFSLVKKMILRNIVRN